jgi:hypothetical protein
MNFLESNGVNLQLRQKNKTKLSSIENEIRRMEEKAKKAKSKGMLATYSNYMLDISILKGQLQKLRTHPHRQL